MRRSTLIPTLLLLAVALLCRAQAPRSCGYDDCSLRLERGTLLQGLSGERVGGAREFGGDVDVLLQGPDSAAAWAKLFLGSQRRTGVYDLVASLGTVAALVLAFRQTPLSDTDSRNVAWVGTVATPLWFFSLNRAGRNRDAASRSLTRSVWWYNRQFADDGVPRAPSMPAPIPSSSRWDWSPVAAGFLGAVIGYSVDHRSEAALQGSFAGASIGEVFALIKLLADRR